MAKKILVVEDDAFLSKIYKVKLEKTGFEVVLAYDGNQAIEEIKKAIPDLILLDLMMPVKDGFTTLSELKENSDWKKIPVIIASNLGQQEDVDKGLKMGASDFIVKSDTSLDNIIDKINKLLS